MYAYVFSDRGNLLENQREKNLRIVIWDYRVNKHKYLAIRLNPGLSTGNT